ncbi:hypothetical protein SDC9_144013 [bioreactor metagenome]|uniref:Uncharacterized protein n=1 Tax=bioreactor metagenome TaxID=1076179 RepID=A0A645E633_9ZZZZ
MVQGCQVEVYVLCFHGLEGFSKLYLVMPSGARQMADDHFKSRKVLCNVADGLGLVGTVARASKVEDQDSFLRCNLLVETHHQTVVQGEVGVASHNAAAGGHLELEDGKALVQVVHNLLCITAPRVEGGGSSEAGGVFHCYFLEIVVGKA